MTGRQALLSVAVNARDAIILEEKIKYAKQTLAGSMNEDIDTPGLELSSGRPGTRTIERKEIAPGPPLGSPARSGRYGWNICLVGCN